MDNQVKLFWDKLLELTKASYSESVCDFFIADAEIIKIEHKIVYIYLNNEHKIQFWKKNMNENILIAGFEIFNDEIIPKYLNKQEFEEFNLLPNINQTPSNLSPNTYQINNEHPPIIPLKDTNLNEKYSFKNFVQGDENRWAVAASIAVVESPGTTYNPLFIWGGPGLGKTHLLNAIGNDFLKNNPIARVKYITAENFINEFVNSIRLDKMDDLKERFRSLDLLLIDDIQSLAKKTLSGTQEEFFNTFNALHVNNKQIVLTSDRMPEHLNDLEKRLVTRFGWGLTINITPPDFETRVAILINKIQDYPYEFTQDTIEYLAGQFDSNVRDLEGALKDISLVASVNEVDTITVDLAAEAIRARKQDAKIITVIPIEEIQQKVGKFYEVTVKEIKSTKRTQKIVLARQVAMYLTRELTDNSLPKIGKEFGGRDHSTVLHAYNKIKNMIAHDNNLRIEIENIQNKIK